MGEECAPTYEYEGGVQVFVVLFHEILVILLCLLLIFFVKPSTGIYLS